MGHTDLVTIPLGKIDQEETTRQSVVNVSGSMHRGRNVVSHLRLNVKRRAECGGGRREGDTERGAGEGEGEDECCQQPGVKRCSVTAAHTLTVSTEITLSEHPSSSKRSFIYLTTHI